MEELAQILEEYRIDIIALQEIRWAGTGEIRKNNFVFFWKGEEKQGRKGTGFMVTKNQIKNVLSFEGINERISKLRIRGKLNNTTYICVYAPTETEESEKKERFYEELQNECEKVPKYDTLIIFGDINAQIGKEDHIREVAGKETIHNITNDNGNRICNLAAAMNLIIVSTKFPHPNRHKITWNHPNQTTSNQIDHVLIQKDKAKTIQDVRSYSGADLDSDHILLVATVREQKSLQRGKNNKLKNKWNVEKIKDPNVQRKLEEGITQKLTNQETDNAGINRIEEQWRTIKRSILTTAEDCVGRKKNDKSKEWYDKECKEATETKNRKWKKWLQSRMEEDKQQYKAANTVARNLCKQKKRKWNEDKMKHIQTEYRNKNTRMFYQKINQEKKKNLE